MMTSDAQQAYVWIWLPGALQPVVAGKLTARGEFLDFYYGRSYLARDEAIALNPLELPLRSGPHKLAAGLSMPGCIRDAAPDAWGRRVLLNHLLGQKGPHSDVGQISELSYLLHSGSDRVGALDFQNSAETYTPRRSDEASLERLQKSSERVEQGLPLTPGLDQALLHGSSIGGARPKALLTDKKIKYIAKFSSSSDLFAVVKAEFIAMRLAQKCGLDVAPVSLQRVAEKDVLLVERFERRWHKGGWQRRILVSALTLLGLDEMMARYASYQDLAERIRQSFARTKKTLRELFARLVFNVLCGNSDDHARNHAAFWDGQYFSLSPAYDICPQLRSGGQASQAMLLSGQKRSSQLIICIEAAAHFLLSAPQALEIIEAQLRCIADHWHAVCAQAGLSQVDKKLLWGRQFLNPFAFENLPTQSRGLAKLAQHIRDRG